LHTDAHPHDVPRDALRSALDCELTSSAQAWLKTALSEATADPASLRAAFPTVGRRCGRGALPGTGWSTEDAVRALLLTALPLSGPALAAEVTALYERGDAAERRAVLSALPLLETADPAFAALGLPLVRDALRSNDTRLIEAALGPYAARRLPDEEYRQAVLKCVFCEIPLDRVAGLAARADGELACMLADFAHERVAAGREIPDDIGPLIRRFPQAVQESGLFAEARSADPARREAALRVLNALTGAA